MPEAAVQERTRERARRTGERPIAWGPGQAWEFCNVIGSVGTRAVCSGDVFVHTFRPHRIRFSSRRNVFRVEGALGLRKNRQSARSAWSTTVAQSAVPCDCIGPKHLCVARHRYVPRKCRYIGPDASSIRRLSIHFGSTDMNFEPVSSVLTFAGAGTTMGTDSPDPAGGAGSSFMAG